MGDYGFEGAGEFGGREENFNCKPDSNIRDCPYVKAEPNDLLKSCFIEYECHCKVRGLQPGEFGGPAEHYMCDATRFEDCRWYKKEETIMTR